MNQIPQFSQSFYQLLYKLVNTNCMLHSPTPAYSNIFKPIACPVFHRYTLTSFYFLQTVYHKNQKLHPLHLHQIEKMTLWNLPTEPFFLYAFYFRYPFVTISTISPVGMENSTLPIYPGATSYLSNTRVSSPFSLT